MAEEIKAIVRRAFEKLWNTGNVAVADEFIATNYVAQIPSESPPLDWEGHKQMHWEVFDALGMIQRIGAVPAPGEG